MKYTRDIEEDKHYLDNKPVEIGDTFVLLKKNYNDEAKVYAAIVSGFSEIDGMGMMVITCINEEQEVIHLLLDEAKDCATSYRLCDEVNAGFDYTQGEIIRQLENLVKKEENKYVGLKKKLEFIKKYINLGD